MALRSKAERRALHRNRIRTTKNQGKSRFKNGSRIFKFGKNLFEEKRVDGQSFYQQLGEKLEG